MAPNQCASNMYKLQLTMQVYSTSIPAAICEATLVDILTRICPRYYEQLP